MKPLLIFISLALVSCGEPSWIERRVPMTDEEHQMIKQHVETVLASFAPTHLSGDDQDLEDIIIEAHREARNSFCRPTLWEYDTNKYTGRWKYTEQIK